MKKAVLFLSLLFSLCLAAFDNAERDPTIGLQAFCQVYYQTWDNGVCYVESDISFDLNEIQLNVDADEKLVIRGSLTLGTESYIVDAGVIYVSGILRNNNHIIILEEGVLANIGYFDNCFQWDSPTLDNYGKIYNAGSIVIGKEFSDPRRWCGGIINNKNQAAIFNLGRIQNLGFYPGTISNIGVFYHCPGSTVDYHEIEGTNIYLDTCPWIVPTPLKSYMPMVSKN
jgi:hypothetical protein